MKECTLFHTGVYESADGVIKENKVYLKGKEDKLYPPETMFLAREECENGLIQFMVEGKWGFADIYSGDIIIDPVWDYLGPFYHGYAHAALDVELEILGGIGGIIMEGGKHGYIGTDGETIIPIEYDDATEIPYRNYQYFKVAKDGKYGLIDRDNNIIIPFKWDDLETSHNHNLIFCGVTYDTITKWGVYDQSFNLIVNAELDEKPIQIKNYTADKMMSWPNPKYYLLKEKKKYGVLCIDGRLISNIELTKKQAIALVESIS